MSSPRESLAELLRVERHSDDGCEATLENFWGAPLSADIWSRVTLAAARSCPDRELISPDLESLPSTLECARAEGWPEEYARGPVELRRVGPMWRDPDRGDSYHHLAWLSPRARTERARHGRALSIRRLFDRNGRLLASAFGTALVATNYREEDVKYLILMTSPQGAWEALTSDEQERVVGGHEAFTNDLEAAGKYVCSYRLRTPAEARTVRRDAEGDLSVLAGAFSETKDEIGGLYVIEADSMEEAVEWARRSRFMTGANEVRPIWE
jgi:hypothetical protein